MLFNITVNVTFMWHPVNTTKLAVKQRNID